MPWTFAHPAAVLPLRRLSKAGYLAFSALAVGSMCPDFLYYLGYFDLAALSHSILGIPVISLPAGLLVLLLASRLQGSVARLLPQPHRDALLAVSFMPSRITVRSLSVVAVSLMIGAATHIAWDACTHETGGVVKSFAILRAPLFDAFGQQFEVFSVLQHLSTAIGTALLAFEYNRYAKSFDRAAARPHEERRRYVLLAALAFIAFCFAMPISLTAATSGNVSMNLSKFLFRQAVYSTTGFLVLVSCVALWNNSRKAE